MHMPENKGDGHKENFERGRKEQARVLCEEEARARKEAKEWDRGLSIFSCLSLF